MNRNILTITLLTGILLIQIACCTKKDCDNAGVIYQLEFFNFNKQDVDTIIVYSYMKNTNFFTPVDSLKTERCDGSGDPYYAYTGMLSFDQDYKIVIVATGQTYTISNIVTKEQGCNTCFPYRPKSDYYISIKSYQLNGQVMEGPRIQIYN